MCTFRKWVSCNLVIPSVSTADRGCVETSVPFTRKRTSLTDDQAVHGEVSRTGCSGRAQSHATGEPGVQSYKQWELSLRC